MKSIKVIYLGLMLLMALFTINSCKDDDNPNPNTGGGGNNGGGSGVTGSEMIQSLLTKNAPSIQKFSFDASKGTSIMGAKRTRIYFPADALQDVAGKVVTGKVDVELKEYISIGDMATSGVTTVSGNEMIESAGMFHINVKQNGMDLSMAPGKQINVNMPQKNFPVNQFELFDGEELDTGNNRVNWRQLDTGQVRGGQDSFGFAFNFNYFKLGYVNIDRFYKEFLANKINSFKINVPDSCDGENTWSLLMFKDYKSCAWTFWDKTMKAFRTGYTLGKGVKCKVLVVYVKDVDKKEYEYAVKDVTLVEDTVVDITSFTPATEKDIEDLVKAL